MVLVPLSSRRRLCSTSFQKGPAQPFSHALLLDLTGRQPRNLSRSVSISSTVCEKIVGQALGKAGVNIGLVRLIQIVVPPHCSMAMAQAIPQDRLNVRFETGHANREVVQERVNCLIIKLGYPSLA